MPVMTPGVFGRSEYIPGGYNSKFPANRVQRPGSSIVRPYAPSGYVPTTGTGAPITQSVSPTPMPPTPFGTPSPSPTPMPQQQPPPEGSLNYDRNGQIYKAGGNGTVSAVAINPDIAKNFPGININPYAPPPNGDQSPMRQRQPGDPIFQPLNTNQSPSSGLRYQPRTPLQPGQVAPFGYSPSQAVGGFNQPQPSNGMFPRLPSTQAPYRGEEYTADFAPSMRQSVSNTYEPMAGRMIQNMPLATEVTPGTYFAMQNMLQRGAAMRAGSQANINAFNAMAPAGPMAQPWQRAADAAIAGGAAPRPGAGVDQGVWGPGGRQYPTLDQRPITQPNPGAPGVQPRYGQTPADAQAEYDAAIREPREREAGRLGNLQDSGRFIPAAPAPLGQSSNAVGTYNAPSGNTLQVTRGKNGALVLTGSPNSKAAGKLRDDPGARSLDAYTAGKRDARILANARRYNIDPRNAPAVFAAAQNQGIMLPGMRSGGKGPMMARPGAAAATARPGIGQAANTLRQGMTAPVFTATGFNPGTASPSQWDNFLMQSASSLNDDDYSEVKENLMAAMALPNFKPSAAQQEVFKAFLNSPKEEKAVRDKRKAKTQDQILEGGMGLMAPMY